MNARSKHRAFLRSLGALIPNADIVVIHERPWHSLTFAGAQICICAHPKNVDFWTDVDALSRLLAEHEFDLRGQIVADISAARAVGAAGADVVFIDALLLDD